MAKLITDHDPFHVHKILGVLVLCHLVYRFFLLIARGYMFCRVNNENCTDKKISFDVACIILHGLLSWSSLLLPLPAKRNFNSPMVWKEFRLHSIAFASRSVLASVITILEVWPSHWALNFLSKLALIMTTCCAADYATAKYGCSEQRTTNSMPYPKCITPVIERGIKFNYAIAQFNATLFCVIESPDLAWTPLVAIQGAPLLMTLVRKGKVTALFYHRGYITQLMMPVLLSVVAYMIHWRHSLRNWQLWTLGMLARDVTAYLRMRKKCSKWTTWTVGVTMINAALYWEPAQKGLLWLHTTPLGVPLVVVFYADFVVRRLICNFLPIFTVRTYRFKMPEEHLKEAVRFVTRGEWNVNVWVLGEEAAAKKAV